MYDAGVAKVDPRKLPQAGTISKSISRDELRNAILKIDKVIGVTAGFGFVKILQEKAIRMIYIEKPEANSLSNDAKDTLAEKKQLLEAAKKPDEKRAQIKEPSIMRNYDQRKKDVEKHLSSLENVQDIKQRIQSHVNFIKNYEKPKSSTLDYLTQEYFSLQNNKSLSKDDQELYFKRYINILDLKDVVREGKYKNTSLSKFNEDELSNNRKFF